MNEIVEKEIIDIESVIYEIDGKEVMLDSDLARLYNVETKRINEAVSRNKEKFPMRISWIISENQFQNLRSQIATLNKAGNLRGQHYKYLPYVLTEQGIMMLSGLLKSDMAVKVNVQIIDAFVKMRRYFANSILNNEILINHENRLLILEDTLDKYKEKEINNIFFKDKLYDAYSIVMDIINMSKEEIIIIDNYAGKELLDMLKDINKKIIIVSKNINDTLKKKYENQYNNVTFINNDSFHDRFIIIDRTKLFVCGASFKDVGKKCFGIYQNKDINYLNKIIETIEL